MNLEERLYEASLQVGMTEEEARVAARDAVARQEWRSRRGRRSCSSCQEDKPVSEFGSNPARRDGLSHYCRECRRVKR